MLEDTRRHRFSFPERGVEIAVIEWDGDGPPALLHHANGFCAALWDPCAQILRHDYRLFAVDARGHGDSSRPTGEGAYDWNLMVGDLGAVASRLLADNGLDRFALGIGHSFGGTLTLTAAARSPELFERIFLVDPVLFPSRGSGVEGFASERRSRGSELGNRARRRRHRWASRADARAYLLERELFAQWIPAALDLYLEEGLRDAADGGVELKCSGEVEGAIFDANTSLDVFAEAERVQVLARLLWAEQGDFPRALYEALVARMPSASIEDASIRHLAPMEEPDRVCDAVRRFSGEPG